MCRRALLPLIALLLGAFVSIGGCAYIPSDRYGVASVGFEGVEAMDSEALGVCLATAERPRFGFQLGRGASPSCGKPPFDGDPVRIRFWRWPWTEWPLYDEFVLERDLQRILRWYAARGYFEARVLQTRIEPLAAEESDIVSAETDCERRGRDDACRMSVTFVIDEGEPVLTSTVSISGVGDLPRELIGRLSEAVTVRVGRRFDEYDYEATKSALQKILAEESYARVQVSGQVQIDRANHSATVALTIDHGPTCIFGRVVIETGPEMPTSTIRAAADIEPGAPYRPSDLVDAQQAIYDLGGLSAVRVIARLPDDGNVVDVLVEATEARRSRFRVGLGVQSGRFEQPVTQDVDTIPQWDIHLSAIWEHRNFLGGLRRLRIEERPRIIFESPFPRVESVALGNILGLNFRQPAFFEPRTHLDFLARWDVGPDPYQGYFRHELGGELAVYRYFFDRKLYLRAGVGGSTLQVPGGSTGLSDGTVVKDWYISGFRQSAILDLRDDEVRTTRGLYTAVGLIEMGYFMPSSWNFVQLIPDWRVYAPLPLGFVFAARFSLGMTFISWASSTLDPLDQSLGPTNQRLRGGGYDSNRGFLPAQLGDGPEGGVRRWLASVELRQHITRNLRLTLFADAGDVTSRPYFRWNYPQLAVGAGLGYITPVGQIRVDIGWRIPGAQVLAHEDNRDPAGEQSTVNFGFVEFPGAVNFAIGDSF